MLFFSCGSFDIIDTHICKHLFRYMQAKTGYYVALVNIFFKSIKKLDDLV